MAQDTATTVPPAAPGSLAAKPGQRSAAGVTRRPRRSEARWLGSPERPAHGCNDHAALQDCQFSDEVARTEPTHQLVDRDRELLRARVIVTQPRGHLVSLVHANGLGRNRPGEDVVQGRIRMPSTHPKVSVTGPAPRAVPTLIGITSHAEDTTPRTGQLHPQR
jgi:hypothetical protein